MKIIVALMVVLISGTLQTTTGFRVYDQPDWWTFIEGMHTDLSSEFRSVRYNVETVHEFGLLSCKLNNRTHAYDAAVEGVQAFITCFRPVLENVTSIVRKSSSQLIVTHQYPRELIVRHQEASGVLANVVCPVVPDGKICFNNMFAASGPCMNTFSFDQVKAIVDVEVPIVEFLCKDHGKWIKDFDAVNGSTCLVSKLYAIYDCVHRDSHENSSETLNSKPLNFPGLEDFIGTCGDLDKLQNCLVRELTNCNGSFPSAMINSLINEAKKVAPCGNLFNTTTNH